MTAPNRIGQVAPGGNNGDREEFTKKDALEGVPLVITSARTAKGPSGPFWILEAARQDTGERVVFTGATVVDQQMGQVREQDAFPVLAMLSKIHPDGGGNPYWMLVDPPGVPQTDEAPSASRVDEVAAIVNASESIDIDDVVSICAELAGEGAKVNDLTDDQYAALLSKLNTLSEVSF